MLGAAIPLGMLGVGEFYNSAIRGITGTYTYTRIGVAYASAFAVLNSFSTNTIDGSFTCSINIYASEQNKVSGYDPVAYENETVLQGAVSHGEWIFDALYGEIIKTSTFTGWTTI